MFSPLTRRPLLRMTLVSPFSIVQFFPSNVNVFLTIALVFRKQKHSFQEKFKSFDGREIDIYIFVIFSFKKLNSKRLTTYMYYNTFFIKTIIYKLFKYKLISILICHYLLITGICLKFDIFYNL